MLNRLSEQRYKVQQAEKFNRRLEAQEIAQMVSKVAITKEDQAFKDMCQ